MADVIEKVYEVSRTIIRKEEDKERLIFHYNEEKKEWIYHAPNAQDHTIAQIKWILTILEGLNKEGKK